MSHRSEMKRKVLVPEKIRVVLVIAHRMVREGMGLLLDAAPGVQLTDSITHPDELRGSCRTDAPDVVIVELENLGEDRRRIARLRRACPKARFVGLASSGDAKELEAAIGLGLSGVYVQTSPSEVLLDLVTRAAAGETVRTIHTNPGPPPIGDGDGDFLLGRLTPRELEVLQELAGGKPTAVVAETLGISPLTVQSHVKSILAKLGVHSKIEAVTMAFRHGLVGRTTRTVGRSGRA